MTRKLFTEWGLYVLLVVMFIINIITAFLAIDLGHQIKQSIISGQQSRDQQIAKLKSNQDQITCIVKGFVDPTNYVQANGIVTVKPFIDKCIKDN